MATECNGDSVAANLANLIRGDGFTPWPVQVKVEEVGPISMEEEQEQAALPAFGSGIAFRPKSRAAAGNVQQQGQQQQPRDAGGEAKGISTAPPALPSFLQVDPMDEDAGAAVNTQLGGGGATPKGPRQRNYRNRPAE